MEVVVEQMVYPTYERYKDSGVEWLGEIPEHWDILRLGAVFQLKSEKKRILFKKVCKAQKFTILGLRNLKSIDNELYTRPSTGNFRTNCTR